jgi:hypothetical protein
MADIKNLDLSYFDFTHHRMAIRSDVSRQPICPVFKGQVVQQVLDCLNIEDGTDMLSRNVGTDLPLYAA